MILFLGEELQQVIPIPDVTGVPIPLPDPPKRPPYRRVSEMIQGIRTPHNINCVCNWLNWVCVLHFSDDEDLGIFNVNHLGTENMIDDEGLRFIRLD